MNKRTLKQGLKTIYQPPKPARKRAFLDSLEPSGLSAPRFLLIQAGYLRPWSWLLSSLVFAASLYIMWNLRTDAAWTVSALLPFVALSTVTELSRSARCRMAELELAARFPLKAVLLARMGLLGLANLLLLAALSPFAVRWVGLTLVETGFYILCPYCLTVFLSLLILRRWHSWESIYACAGVSGAVSVLYGLSEPLRFFFHGPAGYAGFTLLLLALTLREYRTYLLCAEESVWN